MKKRYVSLAAITGIIALLIVAVILHSLVAIFSLEEKIHPFIGTLPYYGPPLHFTSDIYFFYIIQD